MLSPVTIGCFGVPFIAFFLVELHGSGSPMKGLVYTT
jgi:hypothetical protein